MPSNLHGVEFDFDGCLELCRNLYDLRRELLAFDNGIHIAEAQLRESWLGGRADDHAAIYAPAHVQAVDDAITGITTEISAWLDAYVAAGDEVRHRRYQHALAIARAAAADDERPAYVPPPEPVVRPSDTAFNATFS